MLTERQLDRYSRQILVEEIGPAGMLKLRKTSVLVVGAGGLGCAASLYLAAAGVGKLAIADGDTVDISNLNRQVLYTEDDISKPKAAIACARLKAFNPDVHVSCIETFLEGKALEDALDGFNYVIDAVDCTASKFAVNDACVRKGVPFCHAGVSGTRAQILPVVPGATPCCRCVFGGVSGGGAEAGSCAAAGVVGALVGSIGALQALEAVKFLAGSPEALHPRLIVADGWRSAWRSFELDSAPSCEVCRKSGSLQ